MPLKTKMMVAIAPALFAAPTADADLVSTDQISEAMKELVENSSCGDVLKTVTANENPLAASTAEFLGMLVLEGFLRGYAFANHQTTRSAMMELLERCRHSPDEPFLGKALSDE